MANSNRTGNGGAGGAARAAAAVRAAATPPSGTTGGGGGGGSGSGNPPRRRLPRPPRHHLLVLRQELAATSGRWSKARATSTSAPTASTSPTTSSARRSASSPARQPLFSTIPSPRQIKEFLDQYVIGQEYAKKALVRRGPQPLQAPDARWRAGRRRHAAGRAAPERRRDRQEQRPADRPDRQRQDAAGQDAGAHPQRPVRDRRRDDAHRSRLRRRGRREHPAQAAAERRLRPRSRPARHHLHRRDRQDRQDPEQRQHHPRRLRRRRAAGAAEDARRHDRQHPPAGRPQAPRAAVHPDGHERRSCSSAAGRSSAWKTSSASASASGRSASTPRPRRPRPPRDRAEILAQVQPEDLVEFGMIPEFVGRLPVCATLEPLDVETLINILTEPKNALVKQYQKFFRMEGSERRVHARRAGADRRARPEARHRRPRLRAVCEEIMLDLMYKLPDQQQGGKYIINEDIVEGRAEPLRDQARSGARNRRSARMVSPQPDFAAWSPPVTMLFFW